MPKITKITTQRTQANSNMRRLRSNFEALWSKRNANKNIWISSNFLRERKIKISEKEVFAARFASKVCFYLVLKYNFMLFKEHTRNSGHIVPYIDRLKELICKYRLQKSQEHEKIQSRKALILIEPLPLRHKFNRC